MRARITVTNCDKNGKVTKDWFVRVDKTWRVFDQAAWEADGVAWIQGRLNRG